MKHLLIIWHSATGGSEQMARAVATGAVQEAGVETRRLHAQQAQTADVLGADGLIFTMPENLGSMSGCMKDFFDRCYYPLLGRIAGRAYVGLICAGTDGEGAAAYADCNRMAVAGGCACSDYSYRRADTGGDFGPQDHRSGGSGAL